LEGKELFLKGVGGKGGKGWVLWRKKDYYLNSQGHGRRKRAGPNFGVNFLIRT